MNIVEYFERHDIDVSTHGKNVSLGWIGIKCLFCDDETNHLGIRLNDSKVHCWKCGSHSIISVIQAIEHCNHKEAVKILKTIEEIKTEIWTRPDVRKKEQLAQKRDFLPKEASDIMLQAHYDYLDSRELNPFLTTRKYGLLFVGIIGRYKFRIIIPYFYKGVCYTFTSRTIVEGIEPKYLMPRRDSVPITPKETMYNIDNLREYHDCILCEGPVDVWKFGDGAIAITGTSISNNQLLQIKPKKIRNLFIMADNDIVLRNGKVKRDNPARRMARENYQLLKHYAKHTEIIKSEVTNDLGEMTREQALSLKQFLNFNKGL